jgi:hypothetical protein
MERSMEPQFLEKSLSSSRIVKASPSDAAALFRDTLDLRWIRLPAPGARCPWTGMSRTGLNSIILPSPINNFRPPVISTSLRHPGQRKATRLINLGSLLKFISDQAAETTAGALATALKQQTEPSSKEN